MMTRKQFLRSIAGLGVGVLGASMTGCGGDNIEQRSIDAPPPPVDAPECVPTVGTTGRCNLPDDAPAMVCSTIGATIGDNHGHALVVTDADIAAGVEKTYDIKGTSGHPHAVTITAAQFAMLKAHTAIMVSATEVAGHSHDVMVTCAA